MSEPILTSWEEVERRILSPRATLSAESRGRDRAEEPVPFRTAFQNVRSAKVLFPVHFFHRLFLRLRCFSRFHTALHWESFRRHKHGT